MKKGPSEICPKCETRGKSVKKRTLLALLKPDAQKHIGHGPYRFCSSRECDVAYFSQSAASSTFLKDSLTVRVGIKEKSAPRLVCYCFNHSVETIEDELRRTGKCTAISDITSRMKTACWCETKSPMGSCCLAVVRGAVKEIDEKLGIIPSNAEVGEAAPRKERLLWVGTITTAVVASACCWLPLLLVGVGASGAAAAASFETYRPLFLALTLGFLAVAFYLAYRPAACTTGTDTSECCSPPLGNPQRFNRAMLWVVTTLAAAFLFFPNYVGFFTDNGSQTLITDSQKQMVINVDGMTCEACAVTLTKQLAKVTGVEAVNVDYTKRKAKIAYSEHAPSQEALLAAVETAGYSGIFSETPGDDKDRVGSNLSDSNEAPK